MFKATTLIRYDGEPLEVEDTIPMTEDQTIDYIKDILSQGGLVNVQFHISWVDPN